MLLDSLPNLTSFQHTRDFRCDLFSCLRSQLFPNLTELELEFPWPSDHTRLCKIAEKCPNLKKLSLKDTKNDPRVSDFINLSDILSNFVFTAGLTHLSLSCFEISNSSLNLIGHILSLTHLYLTNIENLSTKSSDVLGRSLSKTSVQFLQISCNEHGTVTFVERLLLILKIEHLKIITLKSLFINFQLILPQFIDGKANPTLFYVTAGHPTAISNVNGKIF